MSYRSHSSAAHNRRIAWLRKTLYVQQYISYYEMILKGECVGTARITIISASV